MKRSAAVIFCIFLLPALYVHSGGLFTVVSEENFLSLAIYPGHLFFRSAGKFLFPCLSFTFTFGEFFK